MRQAGVSGCGKPYYSRGRFTPSSARTTKSPTNAAESARIRRGCRLARSDPSPTFPQKTNSPITAPTPKTSTGASSAARWNERPRAHAPSTHATVAATEIAVVRTLTKPSLALGILPSVSSVEANYTSGDDYVVEFLGYRFGFNSEDFEQRVTAAAVKLGLLRANELDDDETADLVELAADGQVEEPRSALGRYLVRHWEVLSLVEGESLVYWLRKLVFRGAWLDHRVKEGLLEVAWDDEASDFGYRDPNGGRALLELAPVPSWHELPYRP
jgi:hypothetical protein